VERRSIEKLKDFKESNPVKVAEYAVANRFIEEPPLSGGFLHMCFDDETGLYPGSSHGTGRRLTRLGFAYPARRSKRHWKSTEPWTRPDFRRMAKVTIAWKTRDCLMPRQAREGDASDLIGYQEINVTSCLT
jgi:hypothetical protein